MLEEVAGGCADTFPESEGYCGARREHFYVPRNPAMLRIEPGRLARARKLWCIRVGPRQYAVQGSSEIRWVDMHGDEPCYCEDALLDDEAWVCKHILRALIYERHPKVMAYLRQEDELEAQRNEWAVNPHGMEL